MTRAYFIHAISPLHPGTGQAQSHIDLPIARLRGTGIPYLPGSSFKGALRAASAGGPLEREVFGPPPKEGDDDRRAGAVAFSDARLLLLPIRSFYGTFAWATSPLLLRFAKRDLGWDLAVPAIVPPLDAIAAPGSAVRDGGRVFLEDLNLRCGDDSGEAGAWADKLAEALFPAADRVHLTDRFLVVSDETMTFLWEMCTQVDARIRIDPKTGVVQDGALWYEESLPSETVLLGVAALTGRKTQATSQDLWDFCLGKERAAQFGGKATVGRGRCRVVPVMVGEAG